MRILKSTKEEISLDKSNGNTIWGEEVFHEMKIVRIDSELYKGNVEDLPP